MTLAAPDGHPGVHVRRRGERGPGPTPPVPQDCREAQGETRHGRFLMEQKLLQLRLRHHFNPSQYPVVGLVSLISTTDERSNLVDLFLYCVMVGWPFWANSAADVTLAYDDDSNRLLHSFLPSR